MVAPSRRSGGALVLLASSFFVACSAAEAPTLAEEAAASTTLTATAAGTPALAASCASPPLRDCAFYVSCLDAVHPCGPSGYARGYGDKYCRRFLGQTRFSAAGTAWSDATMSCLQRRLGRYLGSEPVSCTAIKDGAFDDHPVCYTQPGASVCDLPPSDWRVLLSTIDGIDYLSFRSLKQISIVGATCVGGWLSLRNEAVEAGGGLRALRREIAPVNEEVREKLEILDELQRRIDALEGRVTEE